MFASLARPNAPKAALRTTWTSLVFRGYDRGRQNQWRPKEDTMLDHIFLTVSNLDRSVDFYSSVLPTLGIVVRHDYDGHEGPHGHPDLKGFGAEGRIFFWLRQGNPAPQAVHVGFQAHSKKEVRAAHAAALSAGASEIHPPGPQLHYDPRYFAAQVRDPDAYSLEFVFKSWQHSA